MRSYWFARLKRDAAKDAALQRVERQAGELLEAIQVRRAGGMPMWPDPSDTVLDANIVTLAVDDVEEDVPLDTAVRYSFPTQAEHGSETAYHG
jgi:hypothetical protein